MGSTRSSLILEPKRRHRSWSISQAASISSWIWGEESSKSPKVIESQPAGPIFPFHHLLPTHDSPVLSGTPGYPQEAGLHGSAAQILHRLPGSQPLEPGESGERGHKKATCSGDSFPPTSSTYAFSQFSFRLSILPFPPWDNLPQLHASHLSHPPCQGTLV